MSGSARCDNCQRVAAGCAWVTRADSGMEYHVCLSCRDYWARLGKLMRLDMEAGEQEPIPVKK